MEKIKIKAIINNSENETYSIEAIAEKDSENNTITYMEEDIIVKLTIFKDKFLLSRTSDDYKIEFEFQKDKTFKSMHNITSLGVNIEMDVKTIKLEIMENYLYVQYKISNSELDVGTFEYKLMILD